MDFGTFEGFWQRLARTRLGAAETMAVEALLAGLLERWRTCVICHVLWDRVFDLVADWQAALHEEAEARIRFADQYTWCNRHGWLVRDLVTPRTLGRLQRELLVGLAKRFGDLLGYAPDQPSGDRWDLIPARTCPLCEDAEMLQTAVLEALAHGLASGALRQAYAASAGCCLIHLEELLHIAPDRDTARFLLEAAAAQTVRLQEELDRFEAETESHRRRYGDAADSPVRALAQWIGMRGIVGDQARAGQAIVAPGRME